MLRSTRGNRVWCQDLPRISSVSSVEARHAREVKEPEMATFKGVLCNVPHEVIVKEPEGDRGDQRRRMKSSCIVSSFLVL